MSSRKPCGVIAQLVERCVRNAEVRGSTPLNSTIFFINQKMFLNLIKSITSQKNSKAIKLCFLYTFIMAILLSFQIIMPLKSILNNSQTEVFLNEILTAPHEEITNKISAQESSEKKFFYSIIHQAALTLKEKNILQELSVERFQSLIHQALITQQILFVILFYILFIFLFYIGRFLLNLIGPNFYRPTDKSFWAKMLTLPFCFILTIYVLGIFFNTLFSPFLLLLIAVLLTLLLTVYIKNKN